jgi:hypothetical protein
MGLTAAFNVQLHVPALRAEEAARVLRQQEAFELKDIPEVGSSRCFWGEGRVCLLVHACGSDACGSECGRIGCRPLFAPLTSSLSPPFTACTLAHPRPQNSRQAVDTLTTYCGKEVPIKKLLLWLEMARQELPDPTAKIPLAAWRTVLQDLSS